MDIFKQFQTNENKEVNGVWVNLDDEGKARLLIARAQNPHFREAQQRKMKRYKMAAKSKNIPDDVWDGLFNELIFETILLGWEGMTEGGKPLPYDEENVLRALKMKDFRELVMGYADDMTNYKDESDEAAEKNS